jgi:hypothetical protein
VEIALEAPALLVAGLHYSCARGTELGQLRARSSACRRSFSSARRGSGSLEQPSSLEQGWVVDQGGDGSLGRPEHGDRAVGIGRRQLEREPAGVDVRTALGQPERKLQRGVAERSRERVAY